jgi:hypothetical protein
MTGLAIAATTPVRRSDNRAAPHSEAEYGGVAKKGAFDGLRWHAATRMRVKHAINLHRNARHSISPWVSDLLQKNID